MRKPSDLWEQAQSHGKNFLTQGWSILAVCQGSPWGFALEILPVIWLYLIFLKNGVRGERKRSQMLSLSRLTAGILEKEHTQGTGCFYLCIKWRQKDCDSFMPINILGICQQDRGLSYGDLLWGQLGHVLFPHVLLLGSCCLSLWREQ